MNVEIARLFSSWFGNVTHGANAMLASLPLDSVDDARPAPFELIAAPTSNGDVARDGLPGAPRSLVVTIDLIRNLDGVVQTVTADGSLQMRFRMPVDNAQTDLAYIEASYRVRAVARSFRRLMRDDHSVERTRNGVYLETCASLITTIEIVARQDGNPYVVGYVLPTVTLRDLDPYGEQD